MNLKLLSDDQLLVHTETLVESERRITADAIKHFFEINRRKLYLARGFDSLFSMLTKKYRYCNSTAMLRVNAVRLMTDVPVVIEKIESGEMPVTVVANIQSFLYSEAKIQKPYSKEAKLELVETCVGKSVIEVQKEFVRRNPEIEKRESVRFTSEDRLRVSHSISSNLEEKLTRIKMLWSHVDPNMSREILLDRMAEITLDQIDPIRKAERAKFRAAVTRSPAVVRKDSPQTSDQLRVPELAASNESDGENSSEDANLAFGLASGPSRSRYVSATDARKVVEVNAGSGCEFVDETSGRCCGSMFQLQRDHIIPFSAGGSNDAGNLRILCAQHNRWRWTQTS